VGSDPKRDVVGSDPKPRIAVLISGRGSNLQALIDAAVERRLGGEIAVVISNRPGALGLARAEEAGIQAVTIDHRAFTTRELFERALVDELRAHQVSLVCLAGFMRLLGPTFLAAFPRAILNIHPSLLPSFPGVNGAAQALTHGVKIAGATVHLVTASSTADRSSRRPQFPCMMTTRWSRSRRAS